MDLYHHTKTSLSQMFAPQTHATNMVCRKAAVVPGAANDYGTKLKNSKWQKKVESQGDTFIALCIEAGGRLNEQFLKLIDYSASVNGSTEAERRAFTIFGTLLSTTSRIARSWRTPL